MAARPPSLRAVASFEAAARHQSFAKAAEELNLTHGAISHAVRSLEDRLGSHLFERNGRGVVLTEAGRKLAGRVRAGISLLSEAFETRPWLERSKLVISVLPSFAATFLATRMADFRRRNPDITVELRVHAGLAQIGVDDVDLGIRYGPGGWAGLSAVKLADDRLFPVVGSAPGRALPQTPADLLDWPLIDGPEAQWIQWFAAAGVQGTPQKPSLLVDDAFIALLTVAGGAGVVLARSMLVREMLDAGRVVRLFDIEIPANYAYWLVWNPVSPKQQAIDEFRRWLIEQFQRFEAEGEGAPIRLVS